MKKWTIVVVGMAMSPCVRGGLFDNISGAANTIISGGARQPRPTSGKPGVIRPALIDASQIDKEITAAPKTESFLSYKFGSVQGTDVETRVDVTLPLSIDQNDALSKALGEWFSEISLHYVSDGSLEMIKFAGEHKKYTDVSRAAMYRILRYLEHNFEMNFGNLASQALDPEYSSYPRTFRTMSSDSRWSCNLDTNYGKLYLIVKDQTAHARAIEREEQARQRHVQEQQKSMEERRKHEEELARQREANAQKEREQQRAQGIRQERNNFYNRISECRNGNRRSVYLTPEVVSDAPQFPNKPIVADRVPLFKSIVSGSTLIWVLREYVKDLMQERGADVKAMALNDSALNGFDYDAVIVPLPSRDTGLDGELCLYCTTEGFGDDYKIVEEDDLKTVDLTQQVLHENNNGNFHADKAEDPDVEVFGIAKTFPDGVTAEEVMDQICRKYQNLRKIDSKSSSVLICYDIPGMKCYTTRIGHKFANDTVRGTIEESDYRFEKLDLDSDEAQSLVYSSAVKALKESNKFAAAEFEKSFDANLKQVMANIKNGKFKKELESFQLKAGNIVEIARGETNSKPWTVIESNLLFAMNLAAKLTLSENDFSGFRKDAIKRAKAELAHAQSELENGQGREALKLIPKNVQLKVFDAKALLLLPELRQKRIANKQRKEQEKKDANKHKALDF